MNTVGKIGEIWRYPVKSMRGERINKTHVGMKGVAGDRGWAVRDDEVGEVRGGRNLPALMNLAAVYPTEPQAEPYPAAMITFPDGEQIASNADSINARLSNFLGKNASVWPLMPESDKEHYRRLPMDEAEIRRLFARLPDEPVPDLTKFPEVLMDYVAFPGTYFDAFTIHLVTSSTLRHMEQLNPASNWSVLRFRPNFVIDTGDEPGTPEYSWGGRILKIGEVELECLGPCPRCAMTAHPQMDDIDKDPKILRTIVRETDQNLGIYCTVKKTGQVNTGDTCSLA